jgi:hypothetical protein
MAQGLEGKGGRGLKALEVPGDGCPSFAPCRQTRHLGAQRPKALQQLRRQRLQLN